MSWLAMVEKYKKQSQREAAARDADPWRLPLERLHGQIGDDGLERLTT